MKKANSWNRLLSLVLCICMVLSLMPAVPLPVKAVDVLTENTDTGTECSHATVDSATAKCSDCGHQYAVSVLDEESSDLGDYLPPGTEAGPSISYYDALADVVAAYGTDNNYVPEGDGYTEDVDVESALTGPYTVTIYGAVEVGAGCDWSFKSNKSFVIQQGASLTVNGAFTLNGALTNNGTILLNGTGTIVNNGTGTCGEDVKHLYQVGICLVCKSVCTHTGGSATCTELAVCADCGLSYGDYVDHVFDAETGLCVCGAGKPYEGVSVSGVQVDAANAADVLGDGTVSYDAATNTLTIRDNENIGAVTVTGGTLAVYGDVVLYGDLTASSVELYDGATLVWGDGITVWIDTLSGTGTVINDGARYYDFSNQGVEIVKHTHTKGVAVCGSRRICPDCGRFYGEVVEHVYDENGACVRCERDNAWVVTYTSSNDWENMTASPTATPEFFPNYVRKGEDLVLEAIGAEDGYTLTLRVYVDDVEVYDFTLVKDVLTVPADVITGEVRIEAYADMMDDDVCVYYGVPVFTWAEDYSSASAVMYCADHWCEVTGECTVTTRTVQPTCAADGYLEYAATVTLDLNGIDKTYTDVKTVTLPRLEVHQTANQNSKCPVCGTTLYNIYLGGLQVTERNAADILGDGTVSYDAATGTLTLNGATVDMTETNLAIHDDTQQEQKDRIKNGETFEPYFNPLTPALQITGGELTLVLQGENTLIGLAEILGSEIFEGLIYGVPAVSIADGASLTVTGDDTATLTLLSDDIGYTELDHIPNASSISGGSLTVAGGTVTTFNGIRLTGDYTQTGGSLETGFLEAQNVTVSDGSLNAQGYSGIYPRYFDSNAGGIHGIFANTAINISGGTVTSASGVVGHNGDYSSMNKVDGETVTTHGLYALGSVTVTGGTVTSTGCEDGYYIDEVGFLTKGSYDMVTGSYVVTDEGAPAGSALEAPTWSISEEATFICGSETSHRGGTATCNTLAVCHFCGEAYGETDSANHDTVNAQYTNGFCDGCDIYEAPEAVDGVYQIGNAGELYWFAQQVNGGKRNIKAVLTDDITINENVLVDGQLNPDTTLVSGFRNWTPIGNKTNYYYGSFDGQNHSISGLYYQGGDTYVGLFGYLTYDAAVKNLTLTDSYFDVDASGTSPFYAGGIAGMLMVGSIENCRNEATLCVNYDYNANVGGVAGFVAANGTVSHCSNAGELHGINTQISYMGGIVGNAAGTITNCGNTGDITVDNGVNTVASGVANGGTLKNCFSTGSINVTSEVSYLGGISGSSATATNCYYLEGTADGGIGGEDSEGAAQAMSQEAFASGEVAYLLNGGVTDGTQSWYQTLGTDAYPGFTGGTVYYGYEACYDTDTDYSNDVRYVTIPSHNYSDNGFCVVCDAPQGAQTNDQGIYEIGNAGQLVWFSMYVNAGNYGKSAVLTADIDMEGVEGFAPMCSTGLYNNADPAADGDWGYTGTFDGQGYEISNLSLTGSATETLSYGLFGTVSGTVKNLGMKNFSFVDGGKDCRAGSIVGQLLGGTITDCYAVDCTLDVTEGTTGYIAGGIAGCNYGGTIQNSFVMNCTVKGHSRCAALVADCRGDASTSDRPGTVKNCYSDTTLAGSQKVASYIIDCENYVLSTRFSSGELALLLGDAWGQTIGTDEHPVVGGPAVYKNTCGDGFFYANDETDYDEHTMDGIICSVCGNYQAAVLITEENYASLGADASHVGAYGISNVSQLYWYAALTNGMLTGVPMDYYASGVLLADLDLEGRGWIPIGLYEETIDGMYLSTCWGSDNVWDDVNQRYTTYFDGMGHTISNFNAVGENSQGLFGYIYCASIMNLTVKNATASGWNAGAIAGYPYGCVIDNCSVIGCTISGETATADSTYSVVGAMTGSFYGYIYNSCAYDCTVLRARDEDYLYALGGLEDDGYVYNSAYSKVRYGYVGDESLSDFTYGWYMSEEDMASGYVAYWLSQGYSDENYTVSGDIWGQTIGTDAYPVLGGPAVYQVLDCDGVTTAYSNTNENKSHSYNEYGWCTVCEAECVHTPDETTGNCAVCGNFIIAKGVVAVICEDGEQSEAGYEEGYKSGIRYFVSINYALISGFSELYLYRDDCYSGEFTLNDTTHMVDPQVKLYLNSHTLTMAEDLGVYLGYDLEIIDGTVTGSYDGALLRPYIGTYELTLNGVTLVNEQGYALSNGNEDGGSWKLTLLGGSSLKGAVADVYYSSTEQSGLVFGDSYIGEPIRFALAPEITAENFVLATAAEGVTVDRSWIADNDTTDELYVLRDAENNQLYLGACVEATHEWDWVQLETTHERTCAICSLYESTDHADEIADHLCDTCGKKVSDHDVQEEISWYLSEDGCYANLYVSCPGCDITVYDSGDATLTGSYEGTSCQDPSTVTYSFTYTYDGTEYTVTETLKTGTDPHIGFDSEGFCTACGGYQKPTVDPGEDPEWDYDDVYLIYNAGQLYWFANHVNNVNNGITGKLMANIDLNPGYTFNADGSYSFNGIEGPFAGGIAGLEPPRMWTPIGSGSPCYAGNFDGNGFTVSGVYALSEGRYVGFFGNTDYNYNITNLGITNSYFEGADHVGGLIGYAYTVVKNCYVTDTVYVSGSYATAALIGYNGGEVSNCYAMADTLVDSGGGTVTNSFYLAEEETDSNEGTTALTAEDFASGKAAYLLQSGIQGEDIWDDETGEWIGTTEPKLVWGQTIGEEAYPVLYGQKVYQMVDCQNVTRYSNTEGSDGHSWTDATCTDPKTCSICGATDGEALGHSYEDDVCTACGHIGVPVKLDSASLSFKEKIHYNIFFSLGIDETVDLSNMGLIMFDSLNADGTMDDAIAIYSGAVEMDGKYRVATDGVPAKRMGDTIYFRAYAKLADGSYVYSKTVEYSAVTYAEHILAGDESESAKALVVAMLNYGAAAQLFFGYNTDNLVNAFLTDEQKALPEQYRDDMVNTVPVVAAEKQGIFANNKGFSRRMPAVSFEGAFEINYFFTPAYTPVDGITLYYWTEADFDANEVLTVDNATGSLKMEGTGTEQYRGDIGGIAAKNLSENIYVAAVYSDGTTTWTSGVLGYSIGAYCGRLATNGGAIADLAMATAVYGYHAKQFFGS